MEKLIEAIGELLRTIWIMGECGMQPFDDVVNLKPSAFCDEIIYFIPNIRIIGSIARIRLDQQDSTNDLSHDGRRHAYVLRD